MFVLFPVSLLQIDLICKIHGHIKSDYMFMDITKKSSKYNQNVSLNAGLCFIRIYFVYSIVLYILFCMLGKKHIFTVLQFWKSLREILLLIYSPHLIFCAYSWLDLQRPVINPQVT